MQLLYTAYLKPFQTSHTHAKHCKFTDGCSVLSLNSSLSMLFRIKCSGGIWSGSRSARTIWWRKFKSWHYLLKKKLKNDLQMSLESHLTDFKVLTTIMLSYVIPSGLVQLLDMRNYSWDYRRGRMKPRRMETNTMSIWSLLFQFLIEQWVKL